MNVARPLKFYTLKEFEELPREDGWNYELIDGVVMMSPRPAGAHQMISGNLFSELRSKLRGKGCAPLLEMDLVLENDNLIPDLMIICDDVNISELKRYEKTPKIVIEIVSPRSVSHDCIVKRHKYEQLGILEYWIVSPEENCVDVFCFALNRHEHCCTGQIKSYVLPDLQIDLDNIFDLSF